MTVSGRHIMGIVLSLLIVQATISTATSSRISSLGGGGDYFEDDHNVLRWFGSLPDFGNLAIVELGDIEDGAASAATNAANQGAGVHYLFAETGITGAIYVSDAEVPEQRPGQIALLLSKAWGGRQVGFYYSHFRRMMWGKEQPEPAVQRNVADAVIGMGLRVDVAERFYVDVAGELTRTDREYLVLDSQYDEESDPWRSFAWRLRGFYGLDERIALVPVLDHRKRDHLTYRESWSGLADRDMRSTGIGLGATIFPDGDNLLLASFEFRWDKEDLSGRGPALEAGLHRESWRHGNVLRLAWESRIASWLTLRAGARQVSLHEETRENADGLSPAGLRHLLVKDPELDLTFGLALHLGAFAADFVFNDDAPFSFGHFLTGAGQAETHTFTSITLSATF